MPDPQHNHGATDGQLGVDEQWRPNLSCDKGKTLACIFRRRIMQLRFINDLHRARVRGYLRGWSRPIRCVDELHLRQQQHGNNKMADPKKAAEAAKKIQDIQRSISTHESNISKHEREKNDKVKYYDQQIKREEDEVKKLKKQIDELKRLI